MEDKYFISAKDARELAKTSECLKHRVFKVIKEAAKDNYNVVIWDIYNHCPEAVEDLIITLKKYGYEVKKIDDGLNIRIEW